MNKAVLMGRLTRDPELRTTTSQIPVCSFTLAVDRRFKNASGERQADFISIVAWRQQAEFVSKYFRKGSRMAVIGSIQTRSWDDTEGKRHSVTEVIADEIYFTESKRSSAGGDAGSADRTGSENNAGQNSGEGFFPGPDDDTALPFDI
ncbi:MAG: single-stranded DNA-binding protein [Ruminococcaceae bacterium]|nr:single-stranded DNA-binding protein [Oscillospiraceae bacterium]